MILIFIAINPLISSDNEVTIVKTTKIEHSTVTKKKCSGSSRKIVSTHELIFSDLEDLREATHYGSVRIDTNKNKIHKLYKKQHRVEKTNRQREEEEYEGRQFGSEPDHPRQFLKLVSSDVTNSSFQPWKKRRKSTRKVKRITLIIRILWDNGELEELDSNLWKRTFSMEPFNRK